MRHCRLHISLLAFVLILVGVSVFGDVLGARPAAYAAVTHPAEATINGALRVSGNHFIDGTGATVTLRGASRFSLDLTCTGDGHFALADFQQMRSWGMNAVRIAMNSTYWLNGDNAGCTATNYQATIASAVKNAESAGLYVILVNQWSVLRSNSPMAYPQDLPFWQQVATAYATDPLVSFVPVTEPHNVSYADWYNGWQGGPGMPQLVATINTYAPNHVIFVNGIQWADDLSFLNSQYAITGPNIAYELHVYQNWNPATDADPYMNQYAVMAGEFGTNDWNGAQHNYNLSVMTYFEQHHTGYFAWAWNLHFACDPDPVIFDTTWGHLSWYGQLVHDFIADAVNPTNPPPPLPTPPSWICADVGNATPTGDDLVTATSWTTDGGGSDIWGTADAFHYDYQPLVGDGTVSTNVLSQTFSSVYAKAGVMMRQSTDPASPYYGIFVTPVNGILIQYRTVAGNNAQEAVALPGAVPTYLQVARTGQSYSAYTSVDGKAWTLVPGSTVNLNTTGSILAGLAVTAHNGGALSTVTFGAVTLGTTAAPPPPPPPAATCPTGWTCQDVGAPALAGSTTATNGTWTMTGAGNDVWNQTDQFQYAYQTAAGDGVISAHVTSQTNTSVYAKAGVMFRQGTAPGAAFYGIFVTPANGLLVQYRTAAGANAQQSAAVAGAVPAYLQVARTGQSYAAFTSADGKTWTLVPGSTVNLNTAGAVLVGLAVTSHNGGAISTATFDSVVLGATAPPPPPGPTPTAPPTANCATGWTCQDVGAPALAGTAAVANGVWTISGAGNDVWNQTDQFQYVYQSQAGDGSVSAHVTSQTNTSVYAKAGVMFRQSVDPGAAFYGIFVTPANGILVQYRTPAGANAQQSAAMPGTVPTYIEVSRTGQSYAAFTSADGKAWTLVPGSTVTLNTAGAVLVGLAVTAHNAGALSTATFDTLVTGTTPPPPAPTPTPAAPPTATCATGWTCQDVGAPGLAGSASFTNGVWTISGAGNDVWNQTDQFQYVYQTQTGNGSILAHVTSQTNTSPYAKVGVMFRQSTDTGAAFYGIFVTPANGLLVQYRTAAGVNAQQSAAMAGGIPAYLKVSQVGQTFTAYTSTDGKTWTVVAGSAVTLNVTGPMLAGLAVTAHNAGALSTATLDSVAVTTP